MIHTPPHSEENEKALLGLLIENRDVLDELIDLIETHEVFYNGNHQLICEQLFYLHRMGYPTDINSLCEQLERVGKLEHVGGRYTITLLAGWVTSSAPALHYALLAKEQHLKRQQIAIAGELQRMAYDPTTDVFETFDVIETKLFNISQIQSARQALQISTVTDEVIKNINEVRASENSLTGAPTGFRELDFNTNGWQKTDLVILAARPSVGKTAFALNLALNACTDIFKPTPTALFSLEMGATQLGKRFLSMQGRINLENINKPKSLTEQQVAKTYEIKNQQKKIGLYVDDTPALSIAQFRSKIKRFVKKYGVGLAIIDYLQLMQGSGRKGGNREQEVSEISRQLKIIAKETNVPIIALSQLNRAVEARGNKEPQLSDLRESGAIEQDADVIIFLFNPSEELIKEDASFADKKLISCKKHRNGATFDMALSFKKEIQLFSDIEAAPDFGQMIVDKPAAGMPKNLNHVQQQAMNRYNPEDWKQ